MINCTHKVYTRFDPAYRQELEEIASYLKLSLEDTEILAVRMVERDLRMKVEQILITSALRDEYYPNS